MAKKQLAMVIDLQKCTGCGACALACKSENNTPDKSKGQTFNWADFVTKVEGQFPNVKYSIMPVLCNHCADAPCIKVCPVTPKAMHKHDNGITMHHQERCIGCRLCQQNCPYSAEDVDKAKAAYSVISFNDSEPHGFYRDTAEAIKGLTASGAEVAKRAGDVPPYRTLYKHSDYASVRKSNVVEKCIFCEHRVIHGEQPYCVVVCPSKARVFGDLIDKDSEVSQLLKKYKAYQLKNNKGDFLKPGEKGTRPNVYYVRNFKAEAKKA
jgi:Fe-S-cluster-containing dehydrogenase component